MGDATSWTIFFIGLIAVIGFGLAVFVALVVAVVYLLKNSRGKDTAKPVKQTQSDDGPSSKKTSDELAAYHVVSDTVVGLNVRASDNLFQAIFIFVTILFVATLGAVAAYLNPEWRLPWFGGALVGSITGLVFGFFASGIILMIYRAGRHVQGKHE